MLAATVANAQHIHRFALDVEQYSVHVRPMAEEQLPHLKRNRGVFGGQLAALGEIAKGSNCLFESPKPAQPSFARLLRKQPFKNRVCVSSCLRRDFNAEGHAS